MADYDRLAKEPNFDLKAFVASNFTPPADPDDIRTHIKGLWRVLHREASTPVEGSSLLVLPYPYTVPIQRNKVLVLCFPGSLTCRGVANIGIKLFTERLL